MVCQGLGGMMACVPVLLFPNCLWRACFAGKTVLIDHGLGLRSIYIHLSETFVTAGQQVDLNTKIGAIGQTGRATGPHLHFGMTHDTTPVDPEVVLGPMPN